MNGEKNALIMKWGGGVRPTSRPKKTGRKRLSDPTTMQQDDMDCGK